MHRNAPRLMQSALAGAVGLLVVLAGAGCGPDSLSESETQTVYDIFRSGLEMKADKFVRAETLRALDLAGDPVAAAEAEALLDDPAPVVRVAALRTLLRTGAPESPYNVVLRAHNRADSREERYQIVDIALTEGDERVRRAILERAGRDASARVRLLAVEKGLIERLERLRESEETDDLDEYDLLDDLAGYLDDDDPEIAATALRALRDAGREGNAERFLETFGDPSNAPEQRVEAGQVLMRAEIEEADSLYDQILDEAEADQPAGLGVPDPPVDDQLVRTAVLGKTALGDTDYVEAAKQYRVDAAPEDALQVLEALGPNPSEEAAITLRSDIRSANPEIRRRALALYGEREDARADVFFSALRHDDAETRRRAISALTDSFSEEWSEYLTENLESPDPDRVEQTLRILQQVLHLEEGSEAPIGEVRDRLEQLANGEGLNFEVDDGGDPERIDARRSTIRNLAAFILFRVSEEAGAYREIVQNNSDRQLRAAYLEYLAIHQPAENADMLRDHLRDDLYVMRLMAAAGLWNAFSDSARWPGADPPEETEEGEDDGEES